MPTFNNTSINADDVNSRTKYPQPHQIKQKVFFAKTAQNFYNLAKGYWRPNKKVRKLKIEGQIQKSINILQAYGEYDNFRSYHQ